VDSVLVACDTGSGENVMLSSSEVMSRLLGLLPSKIKATCLFETLRATYPVTQYHIPEDLKLQSYFI
jgi:hypothetical protein